jgi:hypothetical protein
MTMEERVSRLEGAYEQVARRLGDLTDAIARVDAKVDSLRTDMDGRFDSLRSDMDAKLNTLILVIATVGVAIAGANVALAFRV